MASGIEFDSDSSNFNRPAAPVANPNPNSGYNPNLGNNNAPKMSQWLMKRGLVKSAHSAQFILVAVIVFNIIISILIFKYLV